MTNNIEPDKEGIERENVIMGDSLESSGDYDSGIELTEGWHTARFVDWDIQRDVPVPEEYQTEDRKVQDMITLWFDVEGKSVRRKVTRTWGKRSNFRILWAQIFGIPPQDRFGVDLEELIGYECELQISHNGQYTNIDRARPAKTKK